MSPVWKGSDRNRTAQVWGAERGLLLLWKLVSPICPTLSLPEPTLHHPECWDLPFHRGGMTVWCVRFQNPCRNTEIIFSKRRLTPADLTGYWKKDRKRRYKSQTQTNPHRGHTSLNKLCFRINIYTPPSITITFYPLWAEHWQLGGTRDRSDEYSHSATTRSPWLPFLDPIDSKTNNMR